MSDRPTPTPDLPEVHIPPRDPSVRDSNRPLRRRDSMGALNPTRAHLDEANATGYARGLAEAREDALDDLQTILSSVLEARFGEISEPVLDRIAEANRETLKKWILEACLAENSNGLFSG